MEKHMENNENWKDLLKSSFGFADAQLSEQYKYYEDKLEKEGGANKGNFEALEKKFDELKKETESDT